MVRAVSTSRYRRVAPANNRAPPPVYPDKKNDKFSLDSLIDISKISIGRPLSKDQEKQKAFIKKRNLSALSLFLKDWTHKKLYIVPDPVEPDAGSFNLECLVDTSTAFFFAICLLTLLNFSVLYYLLVSMRKSFISTAGRQFFDDHDVFLSLWMLVIIPVIMSTVMLVFLAIGEFVEQSNSKTTYAIIVTVRFLFYGCCIALLIVEIVNWARGLAKLSSYLDKYVNDSFTIYIDPNHTEHSEYKTVWDYTQHAFECCGVNSYQDFNSTFLQSKGLKYCRDPSCKDYVTFLRPRVVPAYPRSCCNVHERVCASYPRADEVHQTGCLERAKVWIITITYIILTSNSLMVLFGIANLISVFLINKKHSQIAEERKIDEEKRKFISLRPTTVLSSAHERKPIADSEVTFETIMKPKSPSLDSTITPASNITPASITPPASNTTPAANAKNPA